MSTEKERTEQKIIQGDCLEVMRGFKDGEFDMALTSPPYDELRDYKGFTFDFENIAKELFRVIATGGVLVWVVGDSTKDGSESGTSFKHALYFKEIGFNLHDVMIYAKQNPVPYHHNRYNPQFEYMFILSKGVPKTFNPIQENTKGFKNRICTGKYRYPDGSLKVANTPIIKETKMLNNIWYYAVGGKGNNHPATFPEKLAHDHIISWSNKEDTVLDPFMGSGTTCYVAKQLGRNFIGIEKNETYCKIARERININSNTCSKCGLYYNPIIEGSIPVNGCKCKEKRPLSYFMENARNAAYSLVVKYTHEITKRDVRLKIMLYEETKSLPDYDREKLVDKIWREIKKII